MRYRDGLRYCTRQYPVMLTSWLVCLLLFGSVMATAANPTQGQKPLGPIEQSIVSWLSLPDAQRAQGNQSFERVFPPDPPNRTMYVQGALKLYLTPPPGGPRAESYLDLAIRLAAGTDILTFDIVNQILNPQNGLTGLAPVNVDGNPAVIPATKHAAVRILGVIVGRQPANLPRQLTAARILEKCDERDAALALLYAGIDAVPAPERRSLRLEALALCKAWQCKQAFTTVQMADPLFTADALLIEKQFPEALAKYGAVLADRNAPLEHRLTAWAGILDTDPASALKMAPRVLDSIEKSDPQLRPRLVVWFGRELWRVIIRELPIPYGTTTPIIPGVSIRTADGWQTSLTESMETLLRIDPEACLRPDTQQFPISLRYPIAAIYALKGDMEKSREITTRRQEFTVPPPPGGWRIFDGTPTPDAQQPRKGVSPTKEESQDIQRSVPYILGGFPGAPKPVDMPPPIRVEEAQALVNEMRNETDPNKLGAKMKALAEIVAESVKILDPLPRVLRTDLPPPPTREVDMTRFAPIAQAVRDALTIVPAQQNSYALLRDGLTPAMLTASNPQLLELLYQLSTEVIDTYGKAWNRPIYAVDAAWRLANSLGGRPVYDMSSYVDRLKAKYPKNP